MDLNKLYEKQAKLDKYILEKHNIKMSKEELLDNTILALLVEVGELANTTRCFKHWSTKGMMDKEVVIEELSDVWHFYLSVGNQLRINNSNMVNLDEDIWRALENEEISLIDVFLALYSNISELGVSVPPKNINYINAGQDVYVLGKLLEFTDEEIEQAYLKKHEENYKRQREGY